jgi:hypothetical protein
MKRFVSVVVLTAFTGCATVQHGPVQRIRVDSDPAGATVTPLRCGVAAKRATTPGEIWVSRRSTRCALQFEREGYYAEKVFLDRAVAPETEEFEVDLCEGMGCESFGAFLFGMAGSLVALGTSLAVDAASGARWEQHPSEVLVPLQKKE